MYYTYISNEVANSNTRVKCVYGLDYVAGIIQVRFTLDRTVENNRL